jgi:hypothetical protein
LALHPASGLLFISLGCLAPWGWFKGLLWLLSPYLMFRLLVLPEYYEFACRSMALFVLPSVKTPAAFILLTVVFILFMALWTMPYLLGFAAVYRSYPADLFWLKRFRRPIALVPLAVLIIGVAIYLLTLPSYSSKWEQQVKITQKLDGDKNKTFIEFSSSDYLKEITANIDGKEETIDRRKCFKKMEYPLEMDWLKEEYACQSEEKGADKLIKAKFRLELEKQPFTVSLKLKSDMPLKIEESNVKYVKRKKTATISWYSFPQQILQPELRLLIPKEAKLEAEIIVDFLETPIAISCGGKNKCFIYRAEISKKLGDIPQRDTIRDNKQ